MTALWSKRLDQKLDHRGHRGSQGKNEAPLLHNQVSFLPV
jgi:hypothetical protein